MMKPCKSCGLMLPDVLETVADHERFCRRTPADEARRVAMARAAAAFFDGLEGAGAPGFAAREAAELGATIATILEAEAGEGTPAPVLDVAAEVVLTRFLAAEAGHYGPAWALLAGREDVASRLHRAVAAAWDSAAAA